MPSDFTPFLWLLKLGALVNLAFLASTFALGPGEADPHIVLPAQILFAVSGYRCLFPNRYGGNIVFHASPLSSTLVTRVLATFVEVAWIYQFSHVLRLLELEHVGWVTVLSWFMVFPVVVSQGFVWSAIVTRRVGLYFWEELGWLIIFGANTLASGYLHATADGLGEGRMLLRLSLLFGVVYLPWQVLHLRSLLREVGEGRSGGSVQAVPWRHGLRDALHQRNRRSDAQAWGGLIGLTWMVAYWATLIPVWVYTVAVVVSS